METLLSYKATAQVSVGAGEHRDTGLTMGHRSVVVGRTQTGDLFSFATGCRIGGACDFFASSSTPDDLSCSSQRCTYSPEQRRIVFADRAVFYRLTKQAGSGGLAALAALYRLATANRWECEGFVVREPVPGEVEIRCRRPSPPEGATGWQLT
ncbi:MAG TPA: hypothetical protein VFU19_11515 [Iamia sp.]|nr:hypothetical protein [Iamia sp.]